MKHAKKLLLSLLMLVAMTGHTLAENTLQHRTLNFEGIEREYFVYLPGAVKAGKPLPVVLAIHGYTSTATGFAASHGMNLHAEANDYIVVYPQGTHFGVDASAASYRVTSWNDLAANLAPAKDGPEHCTVDRDPYPCPAECGQCSRCAWTSCYDDVGFLNAVLDKVEAEFSTDTKRYYMLGVSNGGMMALRMACNHSERFAAVAPIIAQLAPGFECGPSTNLPMMHLAGAKDDTVRIDGKPGGDGFIYATAKVTAETWAHALQCKAGPQPWSNALSKQGSLNCTAYSNCAQEGQQVVSCVNPQGTHEWPGQSVDGMPATCVTAQQTASMPGQPHCPKPSGEYVHWGMDLVWQFMQRYRLP
ncbi:MAG: polyhydroxybutyrate depolymerase [Halieaceae bacterium]|jgi:polyhydroxybutyrate depolymerase